MNKYIHPAARRIVLAKNNKIANNSSDNLDSKNTDHESKVKFQLQEKEWGLNHFLILFLATAAVTCLAFLAITFLVKNDFNQASIAADSLAALLGIPASVAGSTVAIAIAMQSHRVTKRQELFEQRRLIQEITNDASDKIWSIANSIRKFEESCCIYLLRLEEVMVDIHYNGSSSKSFSEIGITSFSSSQIKELDTAWSDVESSIESILESIESMYKNSITRCILQNNKSASEKLLRQAISFHEQNFSTLNLQNPNEVSKLLLLKWANIRQLCDFTRLSLKNKSSHLVRLRRFLLSHPYKYNIESSVIKDFHLGSQSTIKKDFDTFDRFLEITVLNPAYESISSAKFYKNFIFSDDSALKSLSLGSLIPNLNLSRIRNGTPVLNHGGLTLLFISLVFPKKNHLLQICTEFCNESFPSSNNSNLINLAHQLLVDRGVLEALPEWLVNSANEIKDIVPKLYSFK